MMKCKVKFLFRFMTLLVLLSAIFQAVAQPNPSILPSPQKIIYGEGVLHVENFLSIGFEHIPSDEDRFVASEFARIIKEMTGYDAVINEASTPATVVFRRTGDGSQIPGTTEE